ncbi:MAG: VCBS repeat-containing protein [Candidatus Eisenbacteria bacterium]|nr:VCBS repeat-containing protein [Candidatus Eisenbacteria bacterium]
MDAQPGGTQRDETPARITGIAELDRRHGELVASLPVLAPKVAALRLLGHARGLPDLTSAPQSLFYHLDALTRIAALVLAPDPFTSHPDLLGDLLSLLETAPQGHPAFRRDDISQATARLAALLVVEHAIRGVWDQSLALLARISHRLDLPARFATDLADVPPDCRFEVLFTKVRCLPVCSGMHWPYHLQDGVNLPEDTLLTVLIDTDAVPPAYQEAYLAALSVKVEARKTRTAAPTVIRSQDDRGEDLPLGETLKELVREAIDRAIGVLGPSATARMAGRQLTVGILLRKPAPVEEIEGRSLLLPLVLALARQLGEQLNMSARLDPSPSAVWTGDLDRHGNIRSVSGMPLKSARVASSRAEAFGFPEADHGAVTGALAGANHVVSLAPLAHVLDVDEAKGLAKVTRRPWTVRTGFELRRRARPLGVAGVVALGILLTALGFATRNLSSWLDTEVANVRLGPGGDRIELLNSYQRVVHRFQVAQTSPNLRPSLGDVDGDGIVEVFTGTGTLDSLPSTAFCYDQRGRLMWTFRGGFRPDEPVPPEFAEYANTFNMGGAYVRDVDRDGVADVFVVFNHSPFCATQIARLTPDGAYASSFWNCGHCASTNVIAPDLTFDDIDGDGYDEILVAGTSNACDRAVVIVLDPRSFGGRGHVCDGTDRTRSWQSYILLADPEEIRHALRMPRLHATSIEARNWNGQRVIMAGIWLALGRQFEGAFRYRLDRDLNVVDFYWSDWFVGWADSARSAGALPADWSLSRFRERMKQIEVIPGPQWLWEPDPEPATDLPDGTPS